MRINIEKMKQFRPQIDDPQEIPNDKGVYLISIGSLKVLPDNMQKLKYSKIGERYILYAGLSRQGIKSRDYRNHFNGTARISTLRKSLGSILQLQKEVLDDKGRYRYTKKDEAYLTEWMKKNLRLHYQICEDIEIVEKELIHGLNPPLNLKDNNNVENSDFRKLLKIWRNK
jgi:hypothetical protein